MTSINVQGRDWVRTILQDTGPPSRTCYRLGGELAKVIRKDGVSSDGITESTLNSCFDIEKIPFNKVICVAKGYLFWGFGEGRDVQVNTGSPKQRVISSALQKLFCSLTHKSLKLLLPLIRSENQYWDDFLDDPRALRHIWPVVSALPSTTTIKLWLHDIACTKIEKYGKRILFIVLSDNEITQWLMSDHPSITNLASELGKDELVRVWNIMEKIWPRARLKEAGATFLEGLHRRKLTVGYDVPSGDEFLNWLEKRKHRVNRFTLFTLIERVDKVVNEEIHQMIAHTVRQNEIDILSFQLTEQLKMSLIFE